MNIAFNNSVYIPSIDAKDLYLSGHYIDESLRGYRLRKQDGDWNLNRFINSMDYSLDLIKLREIYEREYRRTNLTFQAGGKEYTHRVINVTFRYSDKEYNRVGKGLYVKSGYSPAEVVLEDNLCLRDNILIAVKVGEPVETAAAQEVIAPFFYYRDGMYHAKSNIKAVHTVAQLRQELYRDGFDCEGVHYVRWKRSSGSARVGKCLFVDERLFPRMHKWESMGINPKHGQEIDLAAFESYISLTSSSIIDTMEIRPENILVIDDYESVFNESAVVTRDVDGELVTSTETATISNSIWDGQSLIDADVTSAYSDYGMVLLRNRFFKSCCFRCYLQDWFYNMGIDEVSQLNGWTMAQNIEDIKLITTPSSIKYYKFGTLEQWLDQLEPLFGVVKHDKPTHYFDGDLVQTHYQLLNTLHLSKDEVRTFLQPSLDYIDAIRRDPAVLRYHIKYPENVEMGETGLTSKNEIVHKLLGINPEFTKTKLYTDFRTDLVRSMLKELKCGHVLVHGTYATLCGNPIEMLQATIGRFKGKSVLGVGNIHCRKFGYGQTLLGSRSPHVTIGNVWLPTNVASEKIDRYFPFSNEIVVINSIGENVLQRLSGADMDSDTSLLTDNQLLINAARRHYNDFPVPTCAVGASKVKRYYTPEQQADLDIKTSENLIGDIINLGQCLNSMLWDALNHGCTIEDVMPIYLDAAQLDVCSGTEIDKAKKEFTFDNGAELRKMRKKYEKLNDNGQKIKPHFFKFLSTQKGYPQTGTKAYEKHETTMDYLHSIVNGYSSRGISTPAPSKRFADILDSARYDRRKADERQVSRIIGLVEDYDSKVRKIYSIPDGELSWGEKAVMVEDERRKCSEYIGKIKLDYNSAVRLLRLVELEQYKHIRRRLFHILFGYPNTSFFELIQNSHQPVAQIERNRHGNIEFFGLRFA